MSSHLKEQDAQRLPLYYIPKAKQPSTMRIPRTASVVLVALYAPYLHAFYLDPNGKQQKIATRTPPDIIAAPKVNDDEPSVFPPWPSPLIESHGDYRDEAWLEKHIGGPLYSKQEELPHLPILELQDTLERFIPTALPLAENDEEKTSLLEACKKFPQEAKFLQERLVEYNDKECQSASWLQHKWQTEGYLQVRNPLMEVSYFLFVPDDTTLAASCPTTSNLAIARAAALLTSMAESRKLLCSGAMPYEHISNQPLCSTGFKYLLHSTRIPQPEQDIYHLYDPSVYNHVVVACKGEFFKVDFVDELGDPLPLAVLEERLQVCVDLAAAAQSEEKPQMGWLASMDRDSWTEARQELLDTGGTVMKDALETLESGAFVLCLDDDEPTTLTDAANIFWKTSGNRWADKSMQLVCTANGKVGYIGEHAMLDAAPVIPLIKRFIKNTHKRLSKKQQEDTPSISNPTDGVSNVFDMCWSSPALAEKATELTSMARAKHEKLASDYECQELEFTGYGKKFIKSHGFICHDLVQQAIQLAGYRLFGKQVGTYEAALTRTFLHGRTETARPVSPQSKAFVESMGLEPTDGSQEKKLALLKQAAAVHDGYQNAACNGQGVDRHFFGLAGMAADGDTLPSLFSDPLYLRSKQWKLSTSSVIFTPGFGPSTNDGVAVGYRVEAGSCTFTITSRSENKAVTQFCKLLDGALTEIGELLKQDEDSS